MEKLRVLIVPDKFKGTLSAAEAATAIAQGWSQARSQDSLERLPMSDGGDGFGQVMGELLGARKQPVRTLDAAHRPRRSWWWWESHSKTAVIDSAAVIGLAMLAPGEFHPFELDTFGLGTVIQRAAEKGALRCIMGIGGSATNDGGFGIARALGWRFLDATGRPIRHWRNLDSLSHIQAPHKRRGFREMTVAVDVHNPLLGANGASRVYGPQKGLRPEDFSHAELCLGRLARVVKKDLGLDLARNEGSGAAGGLGFGLPVFLGARLMPGFELFSRLARLDQRLRKADLVITGEGAIDRSTLMGKGTAQVAERCRQLGIPCLALAGSLGAKPTQMKLFTQARALTELTSEEKAKSRPGFWLSRLASEVAASFQPE